MPFVLSFLLFGVCLGFGLFLNKALALWEKKKWTLCYDNRIVHEQFPLSWKGIYHWAVSVLLIQTARGLGFSCCPWLPWATQPQQNRKGSIASSSHWPLGRGQAGSVCWAFPTVTKRWGETDLCEQHVPIWQRQETSICLWAWISSAISSVWKIARSFWASFYAANSKIKTSHTCRQLWDIYFHSLVLTVFTL